jgi:hypothetical protein
MGAPVRKFKPGAPSSWETAVRDARSRRGHRAPDEHVHTEEVITYPDRLGRAWSRRVCRDCGLALAMPEPLW